MLVACVLLNTGLVFWVQGLGSAANEEGNAAETPNEIKHDIKNCFGIFLGLHVINIFMALTTIPKLFIYLGYVKGLMEENRDFVEGAPLDHFLQRQKTLQYVVSFIVVLLIGQAIYLFMFPTSAALACFVILSLCTRLALPIVEFVFIENLNRMLGYLTERPRNIYMLV